MNHDLEKHHKELQDALETAGIGKGTLFNDERMKLFIDAALMNCMDLNYYLFHNKSCHECCDCPLDSVENVMKWLKKGVVE